MYLTLFPDLLLCMSQPTNEGNSACSQQMVIQTS